MNYLPDEISPMINSVIFDRNITGENSQGIHMALLMIWVK